MASRQIALKAIVRPSWGTSVPLQRSFSSRALPRHVPGPSFQTVARPSIPRPSSQAFGMASRGISFWPFASSSQTSAEVGKNAEVIPNVASHSNDTAVSPIPEAIAGTTEQASTFADMAPLSGWPNVNAAQHFMDWMVNATGLPWWANIALVTVSVRVFVLPLVLYGQANAIRMGNINPEMKQRMKEIQYAKQRGDQQLLSENITKVQKLMKDNNCHPFRSLVGPVVQAPIFVTFFFALRGLAEAGLPSMKDGGLSWFTDLTVADPYVILPAVSAVTMLTIIETGAEMGGAGTEQTKTARNVMRGVSVIMIPFIYKFPAAVFCYWVTNNFFSLFQLLFLRIPAVRYALRLPERIVHEEQAEKEEAQPKKGFWDNLAASKTGQKVQPSSVRVSKPGMPSVLQEQRHAEETRERALQKMLRSSGGEAELPSAEHTQQHAESTPTAADQSKRHRVQAARERRQRSKQP